MKIIRAKALKQVYYLFLAIVNLLLCVSPNSFFRVFILKLIGQKISWSASIHRGARIKSLVPGTLFIGNKSIINQRVILDNRGGLQIGNNVAISEYTKIYTASHDHSQIKRPIVRKPVIIENGAFIYSNSIILPGVTIQKNSVVAGGAVVTRNVMKYTIYGGNPAKEIKKINKIDFENNPYKYSWTP